MKHLLFITPGFPKDIQDTQCIPCLQLFALHMSRVPGIKISIVALEYPFEEKEYNWNGIEVHSCGGKNRKWTLKPFNLKNAYQKIKKIHQQNKIDCVQSFWFQDTALLGNHFSKKNNTPHIVTLMGQDVKETNKYLRFFKNMEADFVCLSSFQQALFERNTGKKACVIPLGMDENEFSHVNIKERTIDVLGVGALSEVKQFDHFIEVIRIVHEKSPGLKVKLVGDGPEKESLIALVKKHGLGNAIELAGALDRKKVLELMQQSKILLHTSSFESFGYVYTEALASGMQIVSYPIGIVANLPMANIGNNPAELALQIQTLLEKKIVPQKILPFSQKETIKKYIDRYSSAEVALKAATL